MSAKVFQSGQFMFKVPPGSIFATVTRNDNSISVEGLAKGKGFLLHANAYAQNYDHLPEKSTWKKGNAYTAGKGIIIVAT